MKIRGDLLKISSGALNVKGEKLEPEEQLVRREVTVDSQVNLGPGLGGGKKVGVIPTKIVTETTAGAQAQKGLFLCGNCKHFSNAEWRRDLKNADGPDAAIEKRRAVNQIRAALLQTQSPKIAERSMGKDNDFDVEHALHELGYCRALYAFFKHMNKSNQEAVTLVHPESSCPQDVKSETNPEGFFEYASEEAKQLAAKNYDKIMQMAQGKK
jgi:hypothetical protein